MIIVVRHGRTAANASGLLLGRADPPLDSTGSRQAHLVARSVGNVDRIVSSPLARTTMTAGIIAESAGTGAVAGTGATKGVELDDRFLELDYGEWDGRPVADVNASEWAAWRVDPEFAPPGGESLAHLGRRVRAGLDSLATDAEDRDIVVVTHVSPVKAAVAWALGGGDSMAWRLFVAPGSMTRIAVSGPGRALHSFNETGHLDRS